jgi:hypothetical protein
MPPDENAPRQADDKKQKQLPSDFGLVAVFMLPPDTGVLLEWSQNPKFPL